MRRKSLAKYRMAPTANSPRDGLKIPLLFVTITLVAISSGKSVSSNPADREWIQSTRRDSRNTSRRSARGPVQLRIISASAAAVAKPCAESPTTIGASSRSSESSGMLLSPGAVNTRSGRSFMICLLWLAIRGSTAEPFSESATRGGRWPCLTNLATDAMQCRIQKLLFPELRHDPFGGEPLYYVRDFTEGYGLGEANGPWSDSCADGGENRNSSFCRSG